MVATIDFDKASGIVRIDGTSVKDQADAHTYTAGNVKHIIVAVITKDDNGTEIGRDTIDLLSDEVKGFEVHLHGGNDLWANYTTPPKPSTVYGGSGDDILIGGDANDSILGQEGVDRLWGGGGNDTLRGGNTTDIIHGEEGDDSAVGGNGDDILGGENGNDTLLGQNGNDMLSGGNGNDKVSGGNGIDGGDLGGAGDDTITGVS